MAKCPPRPPIFKPGWIEDGEVNVFDVSLGRFVPASRAEHSSTGPYRAHTEEPGVLFNEIDEAWAPKG